MLKVTKETITNKDTMYPLILNSITIVYLFGIKIYVKTHNNKKDK